MKIKKLFQFENIILILGGMIAVLIVVLMVQIGIGLEKEDKTLIQVIGEQAKKAKIEFDKGFKNDSIQ